MDKDDNLESSPSEELSIGGVLKAEREQKGISKRRLAEMIKVRENVIDAIEDEDWNQLPARVFIKGFIRSYAISVGYDLQKAFRLFDKSMPGAPESTPRPLTGRKKKGKTKLFLILILLILGGAAYYLTVGDKSDDGRQTPQVTEQAPAVTAAPSPEEELPEQVKSATIEIPDDSEDTVTEKTESEAAPAEAVSQDEQEESEETVTAEEDTSSITEDTAVSEEIEEESSTDESAEEEIQPEDSIAEESEAEEQETEEDPAEGSLVLKAVIKERTYVRMIVDDNEPKEYVFQPGRTPQWTGEKGFVVKVGNAGGIEFNFNGEIFDNVGRMGRVKTIRFPEDFHSEQEEE